MTTFYFIRHGQMDMSMAGEKFYKDFAFNMMTLSEKGISQIVESSKDTRLSNAELIITSPFGRTMHSAAILSKELNLEIRVETDLHEWLADAVDYEYLSDEVARGYYKKLTENGGKHPQGEKCVWESAQQMKDRVLKVLEKYKDYNAVIVVCHGTLMQYVLDVDHPENGQIIELVC
jgi:broad specificity phosphatase PhoE